MAGYFTGGKPCCSKAMGIYHYLLNYNFNLKLRAIGRKTPFDAMLQWYDKKPNIFSINPFHLNVGLNT